MFPIYLASADACSVLEAHAGTVGARYIATSAYDGSLYPIADTVGYALAIIRTKAFAMGSADAVVLAPLRRSFRFTLEEITIIRDVRDGDYGSDRGRGKEEEGGELHD